LLVAGWIAPPARTRQRWCGGRPARASRADHGFRDHPLFRANRAY